jgi:hypothetical protein
MKTQFDNLEEAQAEVKRLTDTTNPKFFCPLINGHCNKTCVCIGEPRLFGNQQSEYGIPPTSWNVYSWWCANGMFEPK